MKKTYYIPMIEVAVVEPQWATMIADSNDHGHGGGSGAPERRDKAF